MTRLDHKIPPPIIAVLCAALAWAICRFTPQFTFHIPAIHALGGLLMLTGFTLDIVGFVLFQKAKTTVNPLAPADSTSIVQTGPYAFTRNPMYLGMAVAILGYCAYLTNPIALVAVLVFVAYITRFQIVPEERALRSKFGESYAAYSRRVRRWL